MLTNPSYSDLEDEPGLTSSSPSKRPSSVLSYWVAGRLFLSPHPRECYVCYHDSAPQVTTLLHMQL